MAACAAVIWYCSSITYVILDNKYTGVPFMLFLASSADNIMPHPRMVSVVCCLQTFTSYMSLYTHVPITHIIGTSNLIQIKFEMQG